MEEEKTTNERKGIAPIYLGNLKTRTRKDGGKFLSGTICIEDLQNMPEQYIQTGKNGKHYARVVVEKKFTVDKYNNTHAVKVDTFIPDANFNAQKNNLSSDDGVI